MGQMNLSVRAYKPPCRFSAVSFSITADGKAQIRAKRIRRTTNSAVIKNTSAKLHEHSIFTACNNQSHISVILNVNGYIANLCGFTYQIIRY